MAKAISIYLQDATLAQLDAYVERRAQIDRLEQKTGSEVASRSSIIEQFIREGLSRMEPLTREQIRCVVVDVAQRFGAEKVSLFGSYAHGEETYASDVDLLLEKGDIHGLQVLEFQGILSECLGRIVDVVTTEGASPRFLARIQADAQVLYDRRAE